MNSEEPIENEKIRFNKLKKFIWISYGKYVIICLLIEKTKRKGKSMIITTTPSIEGRRIVDYRGIVFGEVVSGVDLSEIWRRLSRIFLAEDQADTRKNL